MADEKELYDILSMLDRLEDLREDLEEIAISGQSVPEATGMDEDELAAEMRALGVTSIEDVEHRIAELNAQIDRDEEREGGA